VESIASRIKTVLAERKWSERELARRAGLKSETHVWILLKRLASEPTNITIELIERLASACDVSPVWLAFGVGDASSGRERFPKRALAAELCREAGVYEEAIRSVLEEPVREEDAGRPTLWWAARMQAAQAHLLSPDVTAPRTPKAPTHERPAKSPKR